jgi:hypothetical protein
MRHYQSVLLMMLAWPSVGCAGSVDGPQIQFEQRPGEVVIRAGGEPVATYVYNDPNILRPYFKDVCAPGGVQVTRHYPPRPGIDRVDHPTMHPGIFLAFGDLSGADFWRNKSRVEHVEFIQAPHAEEGRGGFAVRNRYEAEPGTICEETCEYTFEMQPGGCLMLWTSTFEPKQPSIAFGDQEEMGLGVRVATAIAATTQQGGRLLDSEGRRGEKEIWGKTAAWCDYSGKVGERFVGIAIMPDPANFRPCWWHVRDYGLMVANPFGRKAFKQGEPSQVIVEAGKPFKLRFAIFLHGGAAEDSVDLKKVYQDCFPRKK